MPHFTPTERKIIHLLSDGRRHLNIEVARVVDPEVLSTKGLKMHFKNLRSKLNPIGQEIVCIRYFGKYYYQHVRFLKNPNEE